MKLLPIHPQPKKGEILSSWMVRLSLENRFHLHTFYSKILGYKNQIWTRDIDRSASRELIELLSRCSGCSTHRLESMTLRNYDGLLYENVRTNGISNWVIPLGIYHRLHHRGMQCCPLCLKDYPYYRLSWRISLFTLCERHKCFLIDECPRCKARIEFHRLGIGKENAVSAADLSFCSKCRFDLSKTSPEFPQIVVEQILPEYAKLLKSVAANTWACELNLPASYPLAFFEGLSQMLSLVNRRSAVALRRNLNENLNLELPLVKGASLEFEFLGIHERYKLLTAALWMMHDWPYRLIQILKLSGLSRSRCAEKVDKFPFWLLSPLNEYLDQRIYSPNSEEVASIIKYLRGKRIKPTAIMIAQTLGVSVDTVNHFKECWKV